jgi:hypothetical protein
LLYKLIEALQILMSDVPLDGDLVDPGQEIGLIDVGMLVGFVFVVLEVGLLDPALPIVEETLDLLHIDDAVNLTCGKFAESVLAALLDGLLAHLALLPVVRDILPLQFLLQ